MKYFCPLISTETEKKEPSIVNCSNCYFCIQRKDNGQRECAIILAADASSQCIAKLNKSKF